MASTPYFILSPSTLLSLVGLFRGPDETVPTPAEDWRQATVDVVIPAFNEERHIVRSLASLLNQTLKPRQIILVDDGSADETIDRARAFCAHAGVKLIAIKRRDPIGKTPTLKRQARDYDSDVEFVLDGDTVLESDNYIERTVQELYQAVGIASACGTILPIRRRDRRAIDRAPTIRAFNETHPRHDTTNGTSWIRDTATGITNLYREVLYLFLQRVIYRGDVHELSVRPAGPISEAARGSRLSRRPVPVCLREPHGSDYWSHRWLARPLLGIEYMSENHPERRRGRALAGAGITGGDRSGRSPHRPSRERARLLDRGDEARRWGRCPR